MENPYFSTGFAVRLNRRDRYRNNFRRSELLRSSRARAIAARPELFKSSILTVFVATLIFWTLVCALLCTATNVRADERRSTQEWQRNTKAILHKLVGDDAQAFCGFSPNFRVIGVTEPNAFVLDKHLFVLSSGLLELARSEDELAFILAHELGHAVLKHRHADQTSMQSQIDRELAADRFAVRLLKDAGFKAAGACRLLAELDSHEDPRESSHPSLKIRLETLAALCGPVSSDKA